MKSDNQKILLNKTWLNTALLYLFIVALLGLFMRFLLVESIAGFNFKYILHAHSHTALLGWVYAALYIAMLQNFIPANIASAKKYKWLFWITQIAVLGMLCSFPFQGYAAVSITFSTMHILCSYVFVYFLLKDLKHSELYRQKPISIYFLKAALLFLVISSFGPFSMGPLMVSKYAGTPIYYLAIYYYLHFQYNGWFTFAVFALIFRSLEQNNISFPKAKGKLFFQLLFWSCFPAYFLSALWAKPGIPIFIIAALAAVCQLAALYVFVRNFFHIWQRQKMLLAKIPRLLFALSFYAFSLKLLMQAGSAIPLLAHISYMIREFVIGYLHLVLLGFVSIFLFAFFISRKAWKINSFEAKYGLVIFIVAFVISELLIFLQGFFYWQFSFAIQNYTLLLFLVSIFLPLGIGMFLWGQLRGRSSHI